MFRTKKIISNNTNEWDVVIKPVKGWLHFNLMEIIKYWDLVLLFVKRDFVIFYKQTILGPLWYIIQPLFNTLVFTLIFGKVAKIPTEGLPPFIFYLSGTVVWSYFATCLNQTGRTFITNAQIFGKVYFPRISVPISIAITSLFQFLIQFIIFIGFLFYFISRGLDIEIGMNIFFLPLILLHLALLSLGAGLIISAATTKYKDLNLAMSFLVQIWMYVTPIVYPLSEVPNQYKIFIVLNPMTAIVESFRHVFLGVSSISINDLQLSIFITIMIFSLGVLAFSKMEKTFMDTI